jgi:hypothetical protein
MDLEQRKLASQKLEHLRSPASVSEVSTRRQFSLLNQELASRATKGDVLAERMLNAASKPPVPVMMRLIQKQKERIPAEEKGKLGKAPVGVTPTAPPRTVSVEDYESVKKMWIKNYYDGDIPISETIKSREDWLKSEMAKISDTIEMITAKDEEKRQQGFERVSAILPFLLLGGFTEEQTIVYLKAKLEAAKEVLTDLGEEEKKKAEAKEELVEVQRQKKEEEQKAAELKEAIEMGVKPKE